MRGHLLIIFAAVLATGCGDGTPFSPDGVDLAGSWVLTEDFAAIRVDGVPGTCRRSIPLAIVRGDAEPAEWVAVTQEGTFVQCTFKGQTGSPNPEQSFATYRVQKTSGNVTISFFNDFGQWHGTLTSENRMGGDLEPELRSAAGTWEARRQ